MNLADVMGLPAPDLEVSALAFASDRVVPGSLFFCVKGFTADGHDFAPAAVERGAAALVVERPLRLGVPEVVVEDARAAMGPAAARFHGSPTDTLRVVGITGTNGKTTTAYLARAILEEGGLRTGLLGTVTSIVGGEEEPVARTTPEAIDLQATFRRMLEAGDEACVMEVSSHALALGRADSINFACRVFTNLSQDHLDFHADMEAYFTAKQLLFDLDGGTKVVNADDSYGRRIEGATTFAIEADADYRARDVSFDATGSSFTVQMPDGPLAVETRMAGLFNVENALAAIAAATELGVAPDPIRTALRDAERVPGRFEPVDEGQDFTVLVDYAHTPEAIENVLRAARELTEGRIHVVFGAGGDRDRRKRPLMGRAAVEGADRVVVTSDNPRSEDPDAIIEEILAGAGAAVEHDVDRRAAIARAFAGAKAGDVVVIAGKGHERGQEFAGGRVEAFDDVGVAREVLRGSK